MTTVAWLALGINAATLLLNLWLWRRERARRYVALTATSTPPPNTNVDSVMYSGGEHSINGVAVVGSARDATCRARFMHGIDGADGVGDVLFGAETVCFDGAERGCGGFDLFCATVPRDLFDAAARACRGLGCSDRMRLVTTYLTHQGEET